MSHSVVVGGAGFIGSWVVEEILKDPEAKVTIIDNLISSEKWNISTDKRVTFIEGSASEMATFEKITIEVDFVFQLACFHGNQSSIARPFDDFENGLKTTLATLEWVKNSYPTARVIYAGAGCAVAEKTWNVPRPVKEVDTTKLLHDSPYSISKIVGEMYCLFYEQRYNLDIVRVRFQNVYGPREILGAGKWRGTEHTIWRNVIPTLIYRSLKGMDLKVFGENASRDFVYVEDVARLVVEIAKTSTRSGLYNIASGEETFILDLAHLIKQLTGSTSRIMNESKREWDNSGRRYGDNFKLASNLNLGPTIGILEGLNLTVKWTIENLSQIQDTILKHNL